MIVNKPYTTVPAGLSAYSQANSQLLQMNIKDILKQAFLNTFLYGEGEDGNDIANAFAETAAGPLSETINDYVINAIKSQMINIVPKTLVTAAGPVTGSVSTLTGDIIIN